MIRDVSLNVRTGEIVGLAGLVGSGKSEVARACFGLVPLAAGRVTFDGADVTGASPRQMLERGFFYVPPDRRSEGLVMMRSVRENITLAALDRPEFSIGALLRRAAERQTAHRLAERLNLQPPRIERDVDHFSGGNQQKVLLAKSLTREVKLFAFDEPTVGVDVGTRVAIYRFIRDLCEAGAAILLISSDLPEILHLTAPRLCHVSRHAARRAHGRGDHRGERGRPLLRARGGMTQAEAESQARVAAASPGPALRLLRAAFVRLGVLPFLLVIAVVVFTLLSDNFLTQRNLLNVARQSSYLTMVSMGQMFALLTGGFDLSVGTTLAVTSVVGATAMAVAYAAMPDCRSAGDRARPARGLRRRALDRHPQRRRRRAVQRLAVHDDARHGVDRLRHRAVPDRRRPGLRHAARVRERLRLRQLARHSQPRSTSRWR